MQCRNVTPFCFNEPALGHRHELLHLPAKEPLVHGGEWLFQDLTHALPGRPTLRLKIRALDLKTLLNGRLPFGATFSFISCSHGEESGALVSDDS